MCSSVCKYFSLGVVFMQCCHLAEETTLCSIIWWLLIIAEYKNEKLTFVWFIERTPKISLYAFMAPPIVPNKHTFAYSLKRSLRHSFQILWPWKPRFCDLFKLIRTCLQWVIPKKHFFHNGGLHLHIIQIAQRCPECTTLIHEIDPLRI